MTTPTITLTRDEATLLLKALAVAIIQAARDHGQYSATGHGALATDATERVRNITGLRQRVEAVWRDRAPDAERIRIVSGVAAGDWWRVERENAMWDADERAREAGG